MKRIDLNCDMGESFGPWNMGADAEVMPWITSANVACGFHAGDPSIMRRTVVLAAESGVAVGAHVGLPDLAGFGRRAMALSAQQVYDLAVVQIGALSAVARTQGVKVMHMKPHGALYHMVERDEDLAKALARAVYDIDASMRLLGRSGGRLVACGQQLGLSVAHEAFADRRYLSDGHLVPRGERGAVIEDVNIAAAQAVKLAEEGAVETVDGTLLSLRADTICVHGDRHDAVAFARLMHQQLRASGVELRSTEH
ncbi:5-oxoprolinase subunit PpxA [Oleiagrimonas citrea]|uniref:5-oxoprolinase subunit A n=1 Tax=Oleiagrimonas citrea TaxID=1665687 RepID=A0A846ZRF1_9GAMM|nr:5-oxoprolinase subunit PxpA [Oleiagrimonas citrea]NKZ40200.1 LamB/YcsF family protein [Oleiagrimonas citrea]